MALNSPGVEITIIDESQYLPAAVSSVPLLLVASAQNKANASSTGIAAGTLASNANKLYRVTSQRDLVTLFGNPFFYKTTNGTSIHGYELNEYGLLAAYSVLGSTNLCYVVRADIDLAELVGRTGRPSGEPDDGTYWLNTTDSTWGIFEFNATTGLFTSKTPIVINDDADLQDTITGEPAAILGNVGDYAITFILGTDGYAESDSPLSYNTYWYKKEAEGWIPLGSDGTTVFFGTNAQQPRWRSTDSTPKATGSVWIKTNSPNNGSSLLVSQYSQSTGSYTSYNCPLSANDWTMNKMIDSTGGKSIPVGTLYAMYATNENYTEGSVVAGVGPLQVFRRAVAGETSFYSTVIDPEITPGTSFKVKVSVPGSADLSDSITVTMSGATPSTFVTDWSLAEIPYTRAAIDPNTGLIVLTHEEGGVIVLDDLGATPSALTEVGFVIGNTQYAKWGPLKEGSTTATSVLLSAWEPLSYIPNEIPPTKYPLNNALWYYSTINQVDIMINDNNVWKGFKNVPAFGSNGLPTTTGTNLTSINGVIISASEPTRQQDGVTALAYGDLWLDSGDLENYPVLHRWKLVDGIAQWVKIDNTDQTTENGIVFADARWAGSGSVDPIDDPLPNITSMLISDYVDLDAPDPSLYPSGTLLFNTRRSGYNVKQFKLNYFNALDFPDEELPQEKSTWVTASGLKSDGSPYMGRKAQRNMIVQSMKAAINTNSQIREEDTFFNLMAAPGYPELQPDMVTLNNDRNQTSYIIGDTPMRLKDDANDIVNWATNAAGATATGDDGLVTRSTFLGIYYPSGITTDLSGAEVVVPSSHMILRTMIYNDTVAYPWFAPAGQRRGIVDNVTNIGYIDADSGEFVVTKNRVALRDIEYTNFINPVSFFTNVGILNFGNKNSFDSQSSLDRTNVARLVCYIRTQLQIALRPFIFEPNDTITRSEARSVVQTLMADILSKRGIYDYLVVCDETNNTPARIDRNELWVDVAIEPTKAAEFIYVPVRLLNTGELQ